MIVQYCMYPRYSYPPATILSGAASILSNGRRSFRQDGLACIHRLQPPLQVRGWENIPSAGPCLVTFNHYFRQGFHAWWMALALAATLPVEPHFVMTGELTFPGKWYALLGQAGSRWLLKRIGRAYGFTIMPPMPPRPQDVEERARSVRAAISFDQAHPETIFCLAPEGGDQPGGVLSWPASGAGRFIALLDRRGKKIVPLGIYEQGGCLCLDFGPAYVLEIPQKTGDEKDRLVAQMVMRAIARQLPPILRGEFG